MGLQWLRLFLLRVRRDCREGTDTESAENMPESESIMAESMAGSGSMMDNSIVIIIAEESDSAVLAEEMRRRF